MVMTHFGTGHRWPSTRRLSFVAFLFLIVLLHFFLSSCSCFIVLSCFELFAAASLSVGRATRLICFANSFSHHQCRFCLSAAIHSLPLSCMNIASQTYARHVHASSSVFRTARIPPHWRRPMRAFSPLVFFVLPHLHVDETHSQCTYNIPPYNFSHSPQN